jgi:hypothetical protein
LGGNCGDGGATVIFASQNVAEEIEKRRLVEISHRESQIGRPGRPGAGGAGGPGGMGGSGGGLCSGGVQGPSGPEGPRGSIPEDRRKPTCGPPTLKFLLR